MTLSKEIKQEIKKIIKNTLIKKINKYKLVGDIKPFHERLFSRHRIRTTSFFHSCSTSIGVTLFQNIAYVIAKKKFKKAEKQYLVEGIFTSKAKSVIEDIIFDLGRKNKDSEKRLPNIKKEIKEVLAVSGKKGNKSTQIADLFLQDNNKEIYIEIKTIKPNKGESKEAKRTLLKIVSLKNKIVKVLVGMAYNPYEPDRFQWPLPLSYFKGGEDLLIGKSFWDFIGGKGTYEELLKIFEEVGKELRDKIELKIKSLDKIKKDKQLSLK